MTKAQSAPTKGTTCNPVMTTTGALTQTNGLPVMMHAREHCYGAMTAELAGGVLKSAPHA